MHPLNNGSQVENIPAIKPRVGTAGYFSESNDGGSPSYPGHDWFNAVIREFQAALSASGVAFDPDKFDHLSKMITNASNGVRNLFEANQNFNVEGEDGHLTNLNQTFTDGQEFSYGWKVVGGTDLVDVKAVDGEVTALSGKIQRAYSKDPSGLLTAETVYGSVTAKSGAQTYADTLLTNGIEVSEDASYIYLTIDFGIYSAGVSIGAISDTYGAVFPISNNHSERLVRGGALLFSNSFFTMYVYKDRSFVASGNLSTGTAPEFNATLPLPVDINKTSVTCHPRSSVPVNNDVTPNLPSGNTLTLYKERTNLNLTIYTTLRGFLL